VNSTDYDVTAGQTIDFRADRQHRYRNKTKTPVRTVMVVAVPNQEWDRRERSA
jgi:hypothetical protein